MVCHMQQIKVMKKSFKDALTIAKRAIQKNGTVQITGEGNEMLVMGQDDNNKTFIYVPLLEETPFFSFETVPAPIDKWLDKKDRELVFEVRENSFYSVEKKKEIKVEKNSEGKFHDLRALPYQSFNNENLFITSLQEANNMFQKSDDHYANYLRLTDINASMFNELFFTTYFYDEQFGIVDAFGTEGIAIHKDAIDVLVKTVKKPKDFGFYLRNNALVIKEGNTVFFMNYKTDVDFPASNSIKSLKETASQFRVNADDIKATLKEFKNTEVKKVSFTAEGDSLIIAPEDTDKAPLEIKAQSEFPSSMFQTTAAKAFFEGLTGEVTLLYCRFDSRRTNNGYFWAYFDNEKRKIMPGIKRKTGFSKS